MRGGEPEGEEVVMNVVRGGGIAPEGELARGGVCKGEESTMKVVQEGATSRDGEGAAMGVARLFIARQRTTSRDGRRARPLIRTRLLFIMRGRRSCDGRRRTRLHDKTGRRSCNGHRARPHTRLRGLLS
jgi:hypothetical protein